MRADTSTRQTAEAKVSASIGTAVSRLNANFNNFMTTVCLEFSRRAEDTRALPAVTDQSTSIMRRGRRRFQIFSPISHKKLFLRGQKSGRLADNRPQSGRQLHGDQHKDDDPDIQARM